MRHDGAVIETKPPDSKLETGHSIECITHAAAIVALCDPVTLTFDLLTQTHSSLLVGYPNVIPIPSLNVFELIVPTDRHTDKITDRRR